MIRVLYNFICQILYSRERNAKRLGVKVGRECRVRCKDWGSEPYLITIGNRVHITKGVQFVTHDGGVWVFRKEQKDFDIFGKICVGDNTYIGNKTIIMPGVKIGKNCVIGAGSIVTKSIPDCMVVAGVPAKFICTTTVYKNKIQHNNAKTKGLNSKEKKRVLSSLNEDMFIKKKIVDIPCDDC